MRKFLGLEDEVLTIYDETRGGMNKLNKLDQNEEVDIKIA